jgi:hypothetical protein
MQVMPIATISILRQLNRFWMPNEIIQPTAHLVCPHESGPLFELVPASGMELRDGQEINA